MHVLLKVLHASLLIGLEHNFPQSSNPENKTIHYIGSGNNKGTILKKERNNYEHE
jgi:hypothetical protein